jgi:hypothetical protein
VLGKASGFLTFDEVVAYTPLVRQQLLELVLG